MIAEPHADTGPRGCPENTGGAEEGAQRAAVGGTEEMQRGNTGPGVWRRGPGHAGGVGRGESVTLLRGRLNPFKGVLSRGVIILK